MGGSVGVKGARVGIDAEGDAYTHAGREGFYVREKIGNKKQKRSSGDDVSKAIAAGVTVGIGVALSKFVKALFRGR
ncbi:hypothetical protein [Sphingomicrobium nitratireducens]|uniref:hypothetical protein n=1 Tax=Sphingomicrobium nitratireducens TaxID=2964666 RepID=UPI003B845E9B